MWGTTLTERPFFGELIKFMTSVPSSCFLEGEGAITYRNIMGATNPKEAAPGTIRADFASTIDENAVHRSDAPDTAAREIVFSSQKVFASVPAEARGERRAGP